MTSHVEKKSKWRSELRDFLFNFVYLTLFFGIFAWYRRLVLAEHEIPYYHYGAAIIKALVLAKIMMVGDWVRLGGLSERWPLLLTALFKALLFMIWVEVFEVSESIGAALIRGNGLMRGFSDIVSAGKLELVATCLITFIAFVPYFAFKEVQKEIGEERMRTLLFRRR